MFINQTTITLQEKKYITSLLDRMCILRSKRKIRLSRPAVGYELNRQNFRIWIIVLCFIFHHSPELKKTMESEVKIPTEKSIIFKRCRWWWLCYRGWNCGVNSIQRIKENEWNELQAWKNVEIRNRGDKIYDRNRCFWLRVYFLREFQKVML